MPMISVAMFPGRTPAQKSALVRELTDAFIRTCGGKPEGVQVTLVEVGADHWATGGVLHSDR
ncbi:tautomerase family protein [Amycolatopsis sp. OK19-0408]|uniref:Tautomerase family protein n=1 Tax=Amycolatopsis iheyensis TaxID=2945988 RepID=A0A9X2N6E0_9PSEU|nr:tautomerase family protein [Amycolatopsis iheyensis]MCR6481356.1 tautomerase family protein [Amycolatopsis iheyensis]